MSAHTPGPWIVEPEEADEAGCYREPCVRTEHDDAGMAKTIAVVRVGIKGMNANAALIAAAPELLEACKRVADWGRHDEGNSADPCPFCYAKVLDDDSINHRDDCALIHVEAAIAKAEPKP